MRRGIAAQWIVIIVFNLIVMPFVCVTLSLLYVKLRQIRGETARDILRSNAVTQGPLPKAPSDASGA